MRKDAFAAENACFREAGRKLSDLRDSQVLVSSIDKLRRHYFRGKTTPLVSQAPPGAGGGTRNERLRKTADSDALKEVTALLSEALLRVKSWPLDALRWKEARRAIRRSYRQSRRAFRIAAKDPSVENMHEWRKRAKDFWYHALLLRRVSPDTFSELSNELQSLTEWIGDDHDIAMLCADLQRRAASLRSAKQIETFLAMLRIRRDELQRAAFALAERLFATRPSDFARRLDEERKLQRSHLRRAKVLGTDAGDVTNPAGWRHLRRSSSPL